MSIKHLIINCATGIATVEDTPQSYIDEVNERQSANITAFEASEAQKATDKANAKAKLIAGEALTEAEADTIVL